MKKNLLYECIVIYLTIPLLFPIYGLVIKLCLTLATPWTIACQAPLLVGSPRQEYWSGLPFPSPGNLPKQGIKPGSPALQLDSCIAGGFFTD